jgi:CSLREA domain-containing protein
MSVQSSIRWTGARRLPLTAAVLLVFGTTAHAATIVVTQDTDAHVFGLCSLREAIQSANEHSAPADTNCLAGSGADDTIQIPFASISLSQGTLAPTGTLLIEGTVEGSRTTVMRPADAPAFPIFSVLSGDLTVQRLQISGGRADFDGYGGGGGINATATVTLVDSVVSGNSSATHGGGGGIYSFAGLTLINSTVSGNTAESLSSSGGGIVAKYNTSVIDSTISGNFARYSGGGIAITAAFPDVNNYMLTISNSTIAGNTAGDGPGGGLFVDVGTTASISNSTVAFNKSNEAATGKGAGIFINGDDDGDGQLVLISTLMTENIRGKYSQDIAAARTVTVGGNHNLVRDVTNEVTLPADTLRCDPQAGALADNGGPTQTIRLAPQSCAIDGGARNNLQYDQRGAGFPRVIGANADIGAIESSDVIFTNGFEGAD